MDRNALVPVMALAIINGIFSPFVIVVFLANWFWYPHTLLPASPQIISMFSALILSTLTLMVSGVPAALYSRLSQQSDGRIAGLIWLVFTALLTLPAVPNVIRALGFSA
ncbi:hypothetical protein [Allomesorhizobium camelthorni]|uniref:Uncharacterized protein n=1 Tax=Allomesorhizobium camelthorni TaxID=475069 RepID=A0A6G4WCA5_9HYPH|nr:hypothetical protein [Mesorhizobium camelthorni]NGO52412.1 hypothetical protein [Mesorhizobium camelthorni]